MLQSVEAKFNKNSIRHSHWEDPHVPLIFFFNFLGFWPRNWMEILFKPALVYQLLVNIRFSVESHYALHSEQRKDLGWWVCLYMCLFIYILPMLTGNWGSCWISVMAPASFRMPRPSSVVIIRFKIPSTPLPVLISFHQHRQSNLRWEMTSNVERATQGWVWISLSLISRGLSSVFLTVALVPRISSLLTVKCPL